MTESRQINYKRVERERERERNERRESEISKTDQDTLYKISPNSKIHPPS